MSQAHVEQVLGRMLTDDGFRRKVSWDPAGACREEGYLLDDWELRMLSSLDTELMEPLAERLGGGIRRFSLTDMALAAPSFNRVTFNVQGE